jgi:hypothetical protein
VTWIVTFVGFAFVYFEDERDGGDAIRALDGYPFGPGRRRLSVEWSRVIFSNVFVNPLLFKHVLKLMFVQYHALIGSLDDLLFLLFLLGWSSC